MLFYSLTIIGKNGTSIKHYDLTSAGYEQMMDDYNKLYALGYVVKTNTL